MKIPGDRAKFERPLRSLPRLLERRAEAVGHEARLARLFGHESVFFLEEELKAR